VAHRTSEIGVRLALGAQPADVSRLIVSQGMAPVLAGLVLGALGAAAGASAVRHLLFETNATDPVVFAGVISLLGVAALLACYLPARRAGKVDPMVAVRAE
jgi:putative ABC transport system permease protein